MKHERGFTLIEVLVAMSILAILALFISVIIGSTQSAIRLSDQVSNADADARLAFDRIGIDLAGLINRSDADFWAGNPYSLKLNDAGCLLLFLSRVTSDNSDLSGGVNRNISLIAYQIAANANNRGANNASLPCLLRAGKAVGSSSADTGFFGLKSNGLPIRFNDTTGTQSFLSYLLPSSTGTTSDFDVLASGVIQMVVGFQLYPDNNSVTLDNGTPFPNSPNSQGQIVYSPPIRALSPTGGGTPVNYVDVTRISAIIVGLVVIDSSTLKLLSPSQVTTLSNSFTLPDANVLPVVSWKPTANSIASTLSSTVPRPALQSLQIYERAYPITPRGEASP